jgi:hypothetical protein
MIASRNVFERLLMKCLARTIQGLLSKSLIGTSPPQQWLKVKYSVLGLNSHARTTRRVENGSSPTLINRDGMKSGLVRCSKQRSVVFYLVSCKKHAWLRRSSVFDYFRSGFHNYKGEQDRTDWNSEGDLRGKKSRSNWNPISKGPTKRPGPQLYLL